MYLVLHLSSLLYHRFSTRSQQEDSNVLLPKQKQLLFVRYMKSYYTNTRLIYIIHAHYKCVHVYMYCTCEGIISLYTTVRGQSPW